jgi:hypothetical protein
MVCEISLKFQAPNIIPTHFHSFQITTIIQSIIPLSTIYSNLSFSYPKESCRNKIFSRFKLKVMFAKKRTPNDLSSPFKGREKEGGERRSQLGGQWKVLMFGGPWKIPMLGGQWKEKEN